MDTVKPYVVLDMPDGNKINFYNCKQQLDEITALFREPATINIWSVPDLEMCGHVLKGETPEDCMKRVYEDIMKENID